MLLCGALWVLGYRSSALALLGVTGMALGFVIGLWLIRTLLSAGFPVFGVARTVIDEAVRMKVVLVLIIGLAMIVPVLPFVLDPKELLKYRVQFFLTWTLSGASVLLSLMTLFLACGTICNELDRKQIFLTLTKPISRGQYLLGKWLGIALLDLLLIVVVGVGIYTFTNMLRLQSERDETDRFAVERQVLVAREVVDAQPPVSMDLSILFDKRLAQYQAEHSELNKDHQPGPRTVRAVQQAVLAKWHTIAPMDAKRFVFNGLNQAKGYTDWVQLRFRPQSSLPPPGGRVHLAIWINGRPYPVSKETGLHTTTVVADNHFHVIDFPVTAASQNGTLEVRIANVNLTNPRATFPSSISFTPGEGLSMLYQVGQFGPNLVRSLGLIWVRLSFLAMLGLMAGSFLGFPVACLLGVLVFVAATANTYLLEAMEHYVRFPTHDMSWWDRLIWVPREFFNLLVSGDVWGAIKIIVRLMGNTFVMLIPSFSDYNPVPRLADGRVISYGLVWNAVLRVGLIWTGFCAFVGWMVFRSRELARVTV